MPSEATQEWRHAASVSKALAAAVRVNDGRCRPLYTMLSSCHSIKTLGERNSRIDRYPEVLSSRTPWTHTYDCMPYGQGLMHERTLAMLTSQNAIQTTLYTAVRDLARF